MAYHELHQNQMKFGPVASQVFWVKMCWNCLYASWIVSECIALFTSTLITAALIALWKSLRPTGMLCEIPALEHINAVRDSEQVWGHREIRKHFSERMQVATGPQHGLLNLFLNAHNWGSVTQAGWHNVPCVWVYFRKYFINSLWRAKSQALRTDLWGLLKPLKPLACGRKLEESDINIAVSHVSACS